MRLAKFSFFSLISCLALGLVLTVSSPVAAQDAQKSQENTQQQNMQDKMQRMQEIGKELQSVQKETLADNPELQERQKELENLVQDTMDQNMAEQGVSMEELKSMQSKMQSQDLNATTEEELKREWQTKVQAYQKARQETMQNQEVQEKRKAFREDMIEAMNEKEPQTESMLDELEGLIETLFLQIEFIGELPVRREQFLQLKRDLNYVHGVMGLTKTTRMLRSRWPHVFVTYLYFTAAYNKNYGFWDCVKKDLGLTHKTVVYSEKNHWGKMYLELIDDFGLDDF